LHRPGSDLRLKGKAEAQCQSTINEQMGRGYVVE
jgi:5-methylcytosine-specific restriction protein A